MPRYVELVVSRCGDETVKHLRVSFRVARLPCAPRSQHPHVAALSTLSLSLSSVAIMQPSSCVWSCCCGVVWCVWTVRLLRAERRLLRYRLPTAVRRLCFRIPVHDAKP